LDDWYTICLGKDFGGLGHEGDFGGLGDEGA